MHKDTSLQMLAWVSPEGCGSHQPATCFLNTAWYVPDKHKPEVCLGDQKLNK